MLNHTQLVRKALQRGGVEGKNRGKDRWGGGGENKSSSLLLGCPETSSHFLYPKEFHFLPLRKRNSETRRDCCSPVWLFFLKGWRRGVHFERCQRWHNSKVILIKTAFQQALCSTRMYMWIWRTNQELVELWFSRPNKVFNTLFWPKI